MALVSSTGGIIEEAARRLNEVSADESDAYLNWMNLCTRDIESSFPNAPFLYTSADRTLSAGTRQYTNLPSDFDKMGRVIYPVGDVKLKFITEEEFAAIQPSASETGTPMVYTIHGALDPANSQVEFFPVPGSALTVNYQYRKLLQDISATSVTPQLPKKYLELYVHYIHFQGLQRREDFELAVAIEAKYTQLKERMKDDFISKTEEPWRIKSIREITNANQTYSDEIVDMFWGSNN